MGLAKAFLVGAGVCVAAVGFAAPALAASGISPRFAAYLQRHPDIARDFARLRAGAGDAKVDPPSIVSGMIATPTVDTMTAPAAPAVTIKFKAPGALGLVYFVFTAPDGSTYEFSYELNAVNATAGTMTFQDGSQPIGLYAAPGTWTLTDVQIADYDGHYVTYTASQIASLFASSTLTVTNNGKPDGAAPRFSTGEILTPTVSISSREPWFGAKLAVVQKVSAVRFVQLGIKNTYSGDQLNAGGVLAAPVKSGNAAAYLLFGPEDTWAVGTWQIESIEVADGAGKSVIDTSAADITAAFGTTTFTVTR